MTDATYVADAASTASFDQVIDALVALTDEDAVASAQQPTSFTITVEVDLGTLVAHLTGTDFVYDEDSDPADGTISGISFYLNGVHQGDVTTSFPVSDVGQASDAEDNGDGFAIEHFFMSFNWTYHGNDLGEVADSSELIGDDVPFNLTGNDTISLGGGDDVFYAGDGTDTVNGDDGNDVIDGGSGSDTVNGGDGDDEIHGGDGADILHGGAGEDTLIGGAGDDTIDGGNDYDDVWYAGDGGPNGVIVNLAAGTATDSYGDTDTLTNIEGMAGTNQNDTLIGNDEDNIIRSFRGNDTVDGRGGSDEIHYGADHNLLYVEVDLAAGTGIEHYSDATTIDSLINIERIRGSQGNDHLSGDDGDNVIKGLAGNDTIDGSDGIDRVDYHNDFGAGGGAGVTVDLGTGTATDGFGDTDTLVNIEDARGTRFNDTITGDSGANLLIGDAGDDTINGGGISSPDQSDVLDGGAGNDTLTIIGQGQAIGGEGDDRIIGETSGDPDNLDYAEALYFNSTTGIVANLTGTSHGGLGAGNTASGFLVSDGLGGTDRLSGLHSITDSVFDDTIYVDSSWTNSYGNYLEIRLGAGDDHIEGDGTATIRVNYGGAGGAVNINLATGTATDANPGDDFIGTDTLINVTQARGTAFDDTITGDDNDNQLRGRDGSDHLYGGAGNDVLYGDERAASSFNGDDYLDGGAGADQMFGGAGNDTYVVDNAGDVVDESVAGSGGYDGVQSALAINLADSAHFKGAIEMGVLTGSANVNLFGNGLNNLLIGNAGNNILNGLAGADQMFGGAGNDTYVVDNAGDVVDESVAGSGGYDGVQSALAINLADSAHFKGAIEMGVLTGSANVNLFGNGLNNLLIGNAGNNILNGLAGADQMRGGAGNDTYMVDNANDIVDESVAGSGGYDGVQSALAINLADSVHFKGAIEMGVLTGSANVNLFGNGLDNLLIGNAGNNILNGLAGADQMRGGAGNDTYMVDNANDIVDESVAGSGGYDGVQSALAINLADSAHFKGAIEMGVLTGSANVNLFGNGLNNLLIGNAGNNILNGLAGADQMFGGAGNDTYVVDNANDIVDESVAGSSGFDTVQAFTNVNMNDGVRFLGGIESVQLLGGGNFNAIGNSLNNFLFGNAGANFMHGLAGDDTMNGVGGNDTLYGGGGADTFVFNTTLNAATNVDTIGDFSAAADTIRLENAIFTALTATGTLAASAFAIGAATTGAQHILYDANNGWLSYDADGNGAGAAIHFATLATHPTITNADFVVV